MIQSALPFADPRDPSALVRQHREQFLADFPAWLADNPHIFAAFSREADRVWSRGRRHYSARTIVEVLRHESALAEVGGEWKINNNTAPDLARLYLLRNPSRAGFFEFRQMPGSARAA